MSAMASPRGHSRATTSTRKPAPPVNTGTVNPNDMLRDDRPEGTQTIEQVLFLAPLDSIQPDPEQPRKTFDAVELNELATNIRMLRASKGGIEGTGVIQALTVRRSPTTFSGKAYYILVAGERRWRAARIAGLTHVPIIIQDISGERAFEVAIYENLQRKDLTPLEEALAVRALMNHRKDSTRGISQHLGKSLGWVNNRLALLNVGEDVQELVTKRPDSIVAATLVDRVKDANARKALIAEVQEGLPVAAVKKRVDIINGSRYKDGGEQRYGRKADPNVKVVPTMDIPAALDSAIRQVSAVRHDLRETTIIKKGFDEKIEPRLQALLELVDDIRSLRPEDKEKAAKAKPRK